MAGRHRATDAILAKRIDLVGHCRAMSMSEVKIIDRLEQEGLFDPAQSYAAKKCIVSRICRLVQKRGLKDFLRAKGDREIERVRYLDRMHFLFERACRDGQWSIARDLSKAIATAMGVSIDGGAMKTADLGALLKTHFPILQRKNGAKQPTITP